MDWKSYIGDSRVVLLAEKDGSDQKEKRSEYNDKTAKERDETKTAMDSNEKVTIESIVMVNSSSGQKSENEKKVQDVCGMTGWGKRENVSA